MNEKTATHPGRVAALDAVRGLAILLVLGGHLGLPGFGGASGIGVTLFFVLSGYLITTILLGGQSLRTFYVRRVRRLLPALVVVLAVVTLVERNTLNAVVAASYFGNWHYALTHEGYGPLGVTWSLAVEEQFYLVWPVLLVVLGRARVVLPAVIALAGLSFALRFVWWPDAYRVYYGSDTAMLPVLVGIVLALRTPKIPRLALLPAGGLIVLVSLIGGSVDRLQGFHLLIGLPACILASAVVIAWAARSSWRQPVLEWFGWLSYGLYLWHSALIAWLGLVGGPVSIAVAYLSRRFLEEPFLHRGQVGQPGVVVLRRPARARVEQVPPI